MNIKSSLATQDYKYGVLASNSIHCTCVDVLCKLIPLTCGLHSTYPNAPQTSARPCSVN